MMSLSIRSAHRAFCIIALTGLLSAHAYAQSGPPEDSCDANPVTCLPQIFTGDPCALSQTAPDMSIVAGAAWDPDFIPSGGGVQGEQLQLLFPSGSGYYGYRPCKGFVVDVVVNPRSHSTDPNGRDSIAWNAGAWDLPSSSQDDPTFPALVRGANNKPQVGYGDANLQDLPLGSHSVPNNSDDCARYHEYVRIYTATVHLARKGHPQTLHWTRIYDRSQVGSWQVSNAMCVPQCDGSSPNCAPPDTIFFPDSDLNAPAIAYRFVIATLLRTSWQQTGLVLWEGAGQPPG